MHPVAERHRSSSAGAADARPKLEVADIFRAHGEQWRQRHAATGQQRKVMKHIETCRTKVLGGHLDVCGACGFSRPSYNSCRDRHCPKCQSSQQAMWVEQRRERILPTKHFHVVFTVPSELRPLAHANPQCFYNLLFASVSETLLELARDDKRLGAQPGITAVLHTWTRKLELHPHLHCIVTGGGLDADGRWKPASDNHLFPVKVLAKLFRGKLMDALEREWKAGDFVVDALRTPTAFARLRQQVFTKDWVVYAKRPFGGEETVFKYLGRYTHRVAISNQRLVSFDDNLVRFITRGDDQAALSVDDFISRFMQHLLPPRYFKIRHFGLYASGNVRGRLENARTLLVSAHPPAPQRLKVGDCFAALAALGTDRTMLWRMRLVQLTGRDPLLCPTCTAVMHHEPLPEPPRPTDTS
jgi:predicted Zn-ribbon and HTH transcriptional regulator